MIMRPPLGLAVPVAWIRRHTNPWRWQALFVLRNRVQVAAAPACVSSEPNTGRRACGSTHPRSAGGPRRTVLRTGSRRRRRRPRAVAAHRRHARRPRGPPRRRAPSCERRSRSPTEHRHKDRARATTVRVPFPSEEETHVPAYVIADVEVFGPDGFKEYLDRMPEILVRHGVEYVVRGGETEVLEGDWTPTRLVILRFDDMEHARRWYSSD